MKTSFFKSEFDKGLREEWTLPPKRQKENAKFLPVLLGEVPAVRQCATPAIARCGFVLRVGLEHQSRIRSCAVVRRSAAGVRSCAARR